MRITPPSQQAGSPNYEEHFERSILSIETRSEHRSLPGCPSPRCLPVICCEAMSLAGVQAGCRRCAVPRTGGRSRRTREDRRGAPRPAGWGGRGPPASRTPVHCAPSGAVSGPWGALSICRPCPRALLSWFLRPWMLKPSLNGLTEEMVPGAQQTPLGMSQRIVLYTNRQNLWKGNNIKPRKAPIEDGGIYICSGAKSFRDRYY